MLAVVVIYAHKYDCLDCCLPEYTAVRCCMSAMSDIEMDLVIICLPGKDGFRPAPADRFLRCPERRQHMWTCSIGWRRWNRRANSS